MSNDRVIPCPTCNYDLRVHLSDDGARCPECGRWSSRPQLLEEPLRGRIRRRDRLAVAFMVLPAACGYLAWGVLNSTRSLLTGFSDDVLYITCAIVVMVLLLAGCAISFDAGYRSADVLPIISRWFHGALYVVAMIIANTVAAVFIWIVSSALRGLI